MLLTCLPALGATASGEEPQRGAVLPAHMLPAGCAACPGICPNKQDGQVLPKPWKLTGSGCGQPGIQ